MPSATGRCLCGDVTIHAPLPSKWVAHCHCTLCQRSSGAAFVTWAGFEAGGCRIEDASGQLQWYRSSAAGERGFCQRCGTTLFFRSPRWAGELHVVRACFDGALDRAPQAHVFWDSRADWAHVDPDDGLPRKTAAEME